MSIAPPCEWARPTLRQFAEQTKADDAALRRPVRCACGRLELPSMMIDVSSIPAEIRMQRVRELPAAVPVYLCVPCVEVLHMLEVVDRVTLAESQGAPPEFCAWLAAKMERNPGVSGRPEKLSPAVEVLIVDQRVAFAQADEAIALELVAEAAALAAAAQPPTPGPPAV